ncbi:hypothetical protein KKC59_04325, partial [bacterium]|nr:hypothetical protein [bacterium]
MLGLKKHFKTVSILIVQFFLFTSINLQDAFSYQDKSVVKEAGQNLAVPSTIPNLKTQPQIQDVYRQKKQEEKSEKNLIVKPEVSKQIKRNAASSFCGGYTKWLLDNGENGGQVFVQKVLNNKNTKILGNDEEADLSMQSALDVCQSIWSNLPDNKYDLNPGDINSRVNTLEFKSKIYSELKILKKKTEDFERLDEENYKSTHKGEIANELSVIFNSFRLTEHMDDPTYGKEWDAKNGNYDKILKLARNLLDKKIQLQGTDEEILKKQTDVLEDIVWQFANFQFRESMGADPKGKGEFPKQKREEILKKMNALLTLFEKSDNRDGETPIYEKIYKILSDYEANVGVDTFEENMLYGQEKVKNGKGGYAGLTVKELWKKCYPEDKEDIKKLSDDSEDEVLKILAKVKIGEFRMAKNYVSFVAIWPSINYRNYRKADQMSSWIGFKYLDGRIFNIIGYV